MILILVEVTRFPLKSTTAKNQHITLTQTIMQNILYHGV
jgi:hypothetical protein